MLEATTRKSSEPAKLHLFTDPGLAVCPWEGLLLCLSGRQLLVTVFSCAGRECLLVLCCLPFGTQLEALAGVVDTGATVPIWKEAD